MHQHSTAYTIMFFPIHPHRSSGSLESVDATHGYQWHRGALQIQIKQNQLGKKLHLTAPMCRYGISHIMINCNLNLLISEIWQRQTSTIMATHLCGAI